MASRGEPARKGPQSGNLELRLRRGLADQEGEGVSGVRFSRPRLISSNDGGDGHERAEMRSLCQAFYTWLQPDKNSKKQMIFCLALEQFLLQKPHRDRAAWQKKWESSGRDLESFMEELGDEHPSSPDLVHVQMKGQAALFSEHMSLGQVLDHFMKQHSETAPTSLTPGTHSRTPQDASQPTGPGDADEHGGSLASEEHQFPSLLILQGESSPGPAEGAVSRESPSASTPQEEAPREETQEATQEATGEAGGGSSGSTRKLYSCDLCSKTFRFLSRFLLHKRRHNNERPFDCATCGKGFFQASDLRVHERIHARKRPFRCSHCPKTFSHKTNLQAHERIHTGDKPYACSECGRTYRQSSTYHRHLRMHQRKASESRDSTSRTSISGASTSGDSTSGASTPRASTPQASTSRLSMPQASTPQASTSRLSTPQAFTPKASTPQASTSRFSMPQASTSRHSKPCASSL